MARTTRSAKLARSCPSPVAASECDWFGEVFGSKDLGPIVLKHMLRLEDIAQYDRACKQLRETTRCILKSARARFSPNDIQRSASQAAVVGNLRLLEFCVRRGAKINEDCADAATHGGHLHILQRMVQPDLGYQIGPRDAMWAAHKGKLHILEWMWNDASPTQTPWDERALMSAAGSGHDACLAFILKKGQILKRGACPEFRISYVDLDPDVTVKEYTNCLEYAAQNGHLGCVKLLKEAHEDMKLTIRAANKAVHNGHLHVLAWMWSQEGTERSHHTMTYAVEGDHVECLSFMYENLDQDNPAVFAWGDALLDAACLLVRPKCLGFLLEQGNHGNHEISSNRRRQMVAGASHHDLLEKWRLECVQVCADHGCVWTPQDLTLAVYAKNKRVVRLLRKLRVAWEPNLLSKLVVSGDVMFEMFCLVLELGVVAKRDIPLTMCCSNRPHFLAHFLQERRPVVDFIEMQACVLKRHVECAKVLCAAQDRLTRERLHDFAKAVFETNRSGARASRQRERYEQDFMREVFG